MPAPSARLRPSYEEKQELGVATNIVNIVR